MNARYRKGEVFTITSGKFTGIRLTYIGFDKINRDYLFKDGAKDSLISIKWSIPRSSLCVLNQLAKGE